MTVVLRQLAYVAGYGALGILLTLAVGIGFQLADRPPLTPWHLAPLSAEFHAADVPKLKSLDGHRALDRLERAGVDRIPPEFDPCKCNGSTANAGARFTGLPSA